MKAILNFISAGVLKQKTAGELCGPCPICGGTDRFVVWSGEGQTGRFLCRHCSPEGGDGIDFLMKFRGLSFSEACRELEIEPKSSVSFPIRSDARRDGNPAWTAKAVRLPEHRWQNRALHWLAKFQMGLHSDAGLMTLENRGLRYGTGARYRLGLNTETTFDLPKDWGLTPWTNERNHPGRVFLPAGLVIPNFRGNNLISLKIRRSDWTNDADFKKYHVVRGSGAASLVFDDGLAKPICVVESELDAILVHQAADDLCTVIALGSASNRPDAKAVELLEKAPLILCALDYDRAGFGGWCWLKEHFQQAKFWPVCKGKDPTAMHLSGVSVRTWIEAGLQRYVRG
jgi:hypothetical protein